MHFDQQFVVDTHNVSMWMKKYYAHQNLSLMIVFLFFHVQSRRILKKAIILRAYHGGFRLIWRIRTKLQIRLCAVALCVVNRKGQHRVIEGLRCVLLPIRFVRVICD